MPTRGLSLAGFLDPVSAMNHFRMACVPKDPSDSALMHEWNTAKGMLGPAVEKAGLPDIRPLPATANDHFHTLRTKWVIAHPFWAQGCGVGTRMGGIALR